MDNNNNNNNNNQSTPEVPNKQQTKQTLGNSFRNGGFSSNQTMRGSSASPPQQPMPNPNEFRNSVLNPKELKPALSMTKFRIIAGILGTIAFYTTCVSEFGDHTNEKKTVTTEFRKQHDKYLSQLLGFDVREKIRNLEKGFFQLRDGDGNKVDGVDVNQVNNNSNNNGEEGDEEKVKSNLFLSAATGGKMNSVKPSREYKSEMDRVNAMIESDRDKTIKLEKLVEKQFQEILESKYGNGVDSNKK